MNAETRKRGLGRGLDALFRDVREEEESFAPGKAPAAGKEAAPFAPKPLRADEIVAEAGKLRQDLQPIAYKSAPETKAAPGARLDAVRTVRIEKLSPGRFQPRRLFAEADLAELADSIAAHGVLQPILVRPLSGDTFEIVGGERRWRAAQRANLHEVPVIVRQLDDRAAMEIGLVDNLQRADLTPLEEAEGYQRLLDDFGHTQESISRQLGKSRPHIANLLRLLKLPESVRILLQQGALSAGHARALVGASDPAALASAIVKKGLSVRQAERLAREDAEADKPGAARKIRGAIVKDVDTLALERKMSSLLGLKVTIDEKDGAGRLIIAFATLDQLDDVLERLSGKPVI